MLRHPSLRLLAACAIAAGGTAPVLAQGNAIDDPGRAVMSLTFGTHFVGEVGRPSRAGVSFKPAGQPRAAGQPWNTIRIIRTQGADYLPNPQRLTFRKRAAARDLDGVLPRLIGPRPARLKLAGQQEVACTLLVLVPEELACQQAGAGFGQTVRADLVEYVRIGDRSYGFDPGTRRFERKSAGPSGESAPAPPVPAAPKDPPPPVAPPPDRPSGFAPQPAAAPAPAPPMPVGPAHDLKVPVWLEYGWPLLAVPVIFLSWLVSAAHGRCPKCGKRAAGKILRKHIVGHGRKAGSVVRQNGVEVSRTGGEEYEIIQDEMRCKHCAYVWFTDSYEEVKHTGCAMVFLTLPFVMIRSFREGRDGTKRIRH